MRNYGRLVLKSLFGLVLIITAGLVLTGCGHKISGDESVEPPAPVAVETTQVVKQMVPVELSATGTVEAVQHAELAFKTMGRVAKVYFDEGDHVRKGQLLAVLEAKDLAASVAQAKAGLENAIAAYQQAKAAYEMQLTKSSVDVQQAEAALEQAKAQLAKAKQGPRPEQIRQAEENEKRAKAAYDEALAYLSLTKEGARRQVKAQAQQGVIAAQQQVTQAEAQLASAKAALATVQADYDRIKNLYEQEVVPKQQFDHVALQLKMAQDAEKQAEAGVAQAKAGLKIAQEQLSIALEGARTQEVIAAEQRAAQAKAAYEAAHQQVVMAHKGGRWEDVETAQQAVYQAEQALRAAKSAQARNKVRLEDVNRAKAGIAQAQAALQAAQTMYGYSRLYAPFSGVITSRRIDPGDMANPGMPVISMDDDSLYRLVATVPESEIGSLKLHQQVTLELPTLQVTLQGPVSRIIPSADPATRTFTVKADLPCYAGVKSGLYGVLKATKRMAERLLVQREAIFESQGLQKAYVVENGKATLALVKLGDVHGDLVEVLSGLSEGQQVIVAPLDKIKENTPVTARGEAR